MKIITKYNIGDKVIVRVLSEGSYKACGRIKSIWITNCGIEYNTRYFSNGELKETYFFEEELGEG